MKKKAVLIIVEGPSEDTALSVLKDFFPAESVKILIAHGDITTKKGQSPATVRSYMKTFIYDNFMNIYKLNTKDIIQIIHIVDTDGAFINDEKIIYDQNANHYQYFTDKILTNDIEGCKKRNSQKKSILGTLINTPYINKSIPYKLYYMSCNMEHVLWDKLEDFSDSEKEKMSEKFDDLYHGKPEEFKKFISNTKFAVQGTYMDTWDFIKKDLNSLNRYSNLHLALP